jgi:hypothetical protein
MPNYLGGLSPYSLGAGNPFAVSRGSMGSPLQNIALQRSNRVASFVRPDLAGVPSRDAALLPMAFPAFSFVLATGTNIITQTANPQTPFRGQRLTCVVIRNGTSAGTTAPVVSQFLIGQKPIITTANGVPLEVFNQSAFDTNLLMPPTVPGVTYTMNVNLVNALTTTDTLLALVSIIGSALL